MGICRTPSLKHESPGYTFRIWACFLSISFLMICKAQEEICLVTEVCGYRLSQST